MGLRVDVAGDDSEQGQAATNAKCTHAAAPWGWGVGAGFSLEFLFFYFLKMLLAMVHGTFSPGFVSKMLLELLQVTLSLFE